MHHLRTPIAVALGVATAVSFAVAAAPASSLLPLGDNKYVTSAARRGYIYLCNARKESNAGAGKDGPWIQGNAWDPSAKLSVDGKVKWPKASFSAKVSGSNRVITTNALPSHTSGTYPIASTDDAYAYDRNPNSIKQQSLSVTLPKDPVVSATPNCMGGEVGIALTGVPVFNGFDAGLRDAAAHELQDGFSGHPQVQGEYHYHNISDAVVKALTPKNAKAGTPVLVGYAYDGFGIFGPVENGKTLTTADLDECHGHVGQIAWDGKTKMMYHYHATKDFPYTVSCFKGVSSFKGPQQGGRQGGGMNSSAGGQTGPQGGPPPEALNACSGKTGGATCSFTDTNGTHAGTCGAPPGSSAQACMPAGGPR